MAARLNITLRQMRADGLTPAQVRADATIAFGLLLEKQQLHA